MALISISTYDIFYGIKFIDEWSYINYRNFDGGVSLMNEISVIFSFLAVLIYYAVFRNTKEWYKNNLFLFLTLYAVINLLTFIFFESDSIEGLKI